MSQPRSSHWRTTMSGFPGLSRQRAYLRSRRNAGICPARAEPKGRRAQPSRAGVATSHLIGRGKRARVERSDLTVRTLRAHNDPLIPVAPVVVLVVGPIIV